MARLFKPRERAHDQMWGADWRARPVGLMLFLIIMAFPMTVIAQVQQAWVARYDGPASGPDAAFPIQVDARGNVYVGGGSGDQLGRQNFTTVKYDGSGNQLWVARYDGQGDNLLFQTPWHMALDSEGNVYVAGVSPGRGTHYDGVIIKYDPNGNQMWLDRYDGPAHGWDTFEKVYVDGAGNVYTTGWSMGVGTDFDAFLLKYDRNGNRLWEARYNGPGNSQDGAEAMALDDMGNIYIAGPSVGEGSVQQFFLAKYDGNGNRLWVARYNIPGNFVNWAEDMILDGEGHVYMTGWSYGATVDIPTVKYDSDGNLLWAARYRRNGFNQAWRLALDRQGGVYVAGSSAGIGTDLDIITIHYNRYGDELWVQTYNGPGNGRDEGFNIVSDAQGNAYVVGWSTGVGTDLDVVTIKYDRDGTQRWVQRYDGPAHGPDKGRFIVLDAQNNVYVSGESTGVGTDLDFVTIKYSQQ